MFVNARSFNQLAAAPQFSAQEIRSALMQAGFIDQSGNPVNPWGIYEAAWRFGVTAPEIDAAMGWTQNNANRYIAENGLLPLTGVPQTTPAPTIRTTAFITPGTASFTTSAGSVPVNAPVNAPPVTVSYIAPPVSQTVVNPPGAVPAPVASPAPAPMPSAGSSGGSGGGSSGGGGGGFTPVYEAPAPVAAPSAGAGYGAIAAAVIAALLLGS